MYDYNVTKRKSSRCRNTSARYVYIHQIQLSDLRHHCLHNDNHFGKPYLNQMPYFATGLYDESIFASAAGSSRSCRSSAMSAQPECLTHKHLSEVRDCQIYFTLIRQDQLRRI